LIVTQAAKNRKLLYLT